MKHRQAVSMEIAYLRLKHTHTFFSEGEISPKSNNFQDAYFYEVSLISVQTFLVFFVRIHAALHFCLDTRTDSIKTTCFVSSVAFAQVIINEHKACRVLRIEDYTQYRPG